MVRDIPCAYYRNCQINRYVTRKFWGFFVLNVGPLILMDSSSNIACDCISVASNFQLQYTRFRAVYIYGLSSKTLPYA